MPTKVCLPHPTCHVWRRRPSLRLSHGYQMLRPTWISLSVVLLHSPLLSPPPLLLLLLPPRPPPPPRCRPDLWFSYVVQPVCPVMLWQVSTPGERYHCYHTNLFMPPTKYFRQHWFLVVWGKSLQRAVTYPRAAAGCGRFGCSFGDRLCCRWGRLCCTSGPGWFSFGWWWRGDRCSGGALRSCTRGRSAF